MEDVALESTRPAVQLGVAQDVLLALLAQAPAHAYDVRARLQLALGVLAGGLNAGQVYVTLGRLEKAGLVQSERVEGDGRPSRKIYALTDAGRARVDGWLEDTSWPKPAPAEFHLKLVAAATTRLADPVRLVDRQRHALLQELAHVQRAALGEPADSVAALVLEGVVLRLQADLRWLEACARFWTLTKERA
jgi:DNA-binding PadR family transcriptional regulator